MEVSAAYRGVRLVAALLTREIALAIVVRQPAARKVVVPCRL